MQIPAELRSLIESGAPAHLVTFNRNGSPHLTLVWIGLDGDEVVAAHLPENLTVKNIRRNPQVALSLQANTKNAIRLREYAVVCGEAEIEEGGAPELLQRLGRVYIGPGVKFPPMDSPPPGYITRIRVRQIAGVGPRAGRAA